MPPHREVRPGRAAPGPGPAYPPARRPGSPAGTRGGDTGAGNDERREILRQRLGNRECALRFPSGSCEEPTRLAAFAWLITSARLSARLPSTCLPPRSPRPPLRPLGLLPAAAPGLPAPPPRRRLRPRPGPLSPLSAGRALAAQARTPSPAFLLLLLRWRARPRGSGSGARAQAGGREGGGCRRRRRAGRQAGSSLRAQCWSAGGRPGMRSNGRGRLGQQQRRR